MRDSIKTTHVDRVIAERTPSLKAEDVALTRELSAQAMANPHLGPFFVAEMENQIFGERLPEEGGSAAKLRLDKQRAEAGREDTGGRGIG